MWRRQAESAILFGAGGSALTYPEQRRHPRLPVLVDCRIEGASGRSEIRLTDLSATGCFVDTSMSFPAGAHITVYAMLGESEVATPRPSGTDASRVRIRVCHRPRQDGGVVPATVRGVHQGTVAVVRTARLLLTSSCAVALGVDARRAVDGVSHGEGAERRRGDGQLDCSRAADSRRKAGPVRRLELRRCSGLSRRSAAAAAGHAAAGDVLEHRSRDQGRPAVHTVWARNCGASEWRATARTTPMPPACQSATCSRTPTRSPGS